MKQMFPIFAGLTAVVLTGLVPVDARAKPETLQNYIAVNAAIAGIDEIIVVGDRGDFLQKVPATPELVAIASGAKDSMFLSIENPSQYIEDGYVLVNVVPFATRRDMGWDVQEGCDYRIFYGAPADMSNGMYAVELCATAQELHDAGVF